MSAATAEAPARAAGSMSGPMPASQLASEPSAVSGSAPSLAAVARLLSRLDAVPPAPRAGAVPGALTRGGAARARPA